MPIPDCAPLFIAMDRGYFRAEGLNVEVKTIQGGGPAIPQLLAGGLHFSLLNYVAAIALEAKAPGSLKIVSDGYQADRGAFRLMVAKTSPLTSLTDLKTAPNGEKKTIATATLHSIGTLSAEVALKAHLLTKDDVKWVEVPLPNMPAALASGQIDVAWMTEPFITQHAEAGGRSLYDVMQGPTADFPIAGWGTSATYATQQPRIVAAFQRAMARGQADADDRTAVTQALSRHTKIPAVLTPTIALGRFPLTLDVSRLQYVADTMLEHRYLTDQFDIAPMLVPLPSGVLPSAGATP